MQQNKMLGILIAGAALLAASLLAQGQNPETKESLEKKLQAQYTLTKLTADRRGVVTAGAVLTLKKDGLVMVPSTSSLVCGNQYKGGKVTIGLMARALCEKGVPGAGGSARKFVSGEKLNAVKIEVKDKAVVFDLYSVDAYADTYYRAELTFPLDKGGLPSAADMLAATGEVFDVTPPATAQPDADVAPAASAQPTPAQPPAQAAPDSPPAKYGDIPPPPPPPPAPLALKLGQTIDQVVAELGQPITTANAGDKQIYLFKEWKVTFVNGKVADIDAR